MQNQKKIEFHSRHRTLPTRIFALVLCGFSLFVGCEKKPEFGQISGTVDQEGQPLDEVRVMFLPDPLADNQGAHSECITDDAGKYELVYSQDPKTKGAIVGSHRVVIEDIAAENSRDRYRPIRIDASYSNSARTPLTYEVTPGEHVFDIHLKRKK